MRPYCCVFVLISCLLSESDAQVLRYQETCAKSMELPFNMGGFDMVQDSAGIVYFATVDGVWTFDGVNMRLYRLDHRRYPEPPPQYVMTLLITPDQTVWAGLRNGLARLNRRSGFLEEVVIAKNKTADIAFNLFQDQEGYIWVDTYDGYPERGIATRFHPRSGRKMTYYLRDEHGVLLQERIEAILHDALGFRCLTAKGSYLIQPQTDSTGIAIPLSWPGGSANAHLRSLLAKDIAGQYWATDTLGRLYRGPNLEQLRLFEAIPGISDWRQVKLSIDRLGRVWMYDANLAVFDPSTGEGQLIALKACDDDKATQESIKFVFHDRQNVHWVARGPRHAGGTIQLLTEMPRRFQVWEPEPRPTHFFHIYREPGHGDIWAGSYASGAYQLDARFQIKKRLEMADGLTTNRIIFLAPAGPDEIWFNTVPIGIVRYHKRKNTLKPLEAPDGKPYQECFLLKDGRVFLAAYNETCIYDPRTGVFQPNPPLPKHGIGNQAFRFVQDIEEDGNDIWMGGYDKRIHRLNLKTLQLSTIDDPFIRHNVMCLKRRGDSLYVGTLGQGLAIYDLKKQRFVANYMTPQGFPHHSLYGIEMDQKRRLWIFSSSGLTLFEPEKNRFTEFTTIDGVPWEGFHSGAVFQDDRGYLYGCGEGILWFHPDSLVVSKPDYPAHITITDLLLAGESRLPEAGKTLVLAPDENYFEIRFSNLDYGFPRADSFWYQMEGLDETWRLTSEHKVTFNRLPPGRYVFKLRGSNRFGVISPVEARLSIRIEAWWWQKTWVKAAFALGVLLLGAYGWHGYNTRKNAREKALQVQMQLKSLQALRGQLNHHFVKNTIGRANAKLLSENIEEANQYLGQLAKLMELVLVGAKNDFYSLKMESDIMRLYLDIQSKRWPGGFEYHYESPPKLEQEGWYVPAMLVQPLAENAIEHGLLPKPNPPRLLEITWSETPEALHCCIRDTGTGLNKKQGNSENSTKVGLENIRSRLDTIRALYRIDLGMNILEPPEGGVRVELRMPKLSNDPSLV